MTGRARQRGFALLIVLWSMALLALIGTRVVASGHVEARLAANLGAASVAEAAADGAVFTALWHAMDGGGGHWPADGQPRRVALARATAEVSMVAENAKITLNNSPLPLLQGLLRTLGLPDQAAATMTARIADWRSPARLPVAGGAKAAQYRAAGKDWGPPNGPFRGTDELGMVLGMTPELAARIARYVSPYIQSTPPPTATDPVVRAAMALAAANGAPPLSFDEPLVLSITATATSAGGGHFTRRAVIRVNSDLATNPGTAQFDILDWDRE